VLDESKRRLTHVIAVASLLTLGVPGSARAYSKVIHSWRVNTSVNGHLKGPFLYDPYAGSYPLYDRTAVPENAGMGYNETGFVSTVSRSVQITMCTSAASSGFGYAAVKIVNEYGQEIFFNLADPYASCIQWSGRVTANVSMFMRGYWGDAWEPAMVTTTVIDVGTGQKLLDWIIQTY
jgi:hypothetical protein